jgi:hypothetical protein
MNLSDLDQFEPEPAPPIKKQPLKLVGLLILLALTAPLWVLVFGVASPLAYAGDWVVRGWRRVTGHTEPERTLKYSFHSTMPDGTTAHFQIMKTHRLTESID